MISAFVLAFALKQDVLEVLFGLDSEKMSEIIFS